MGRSADGGLDQVPLREAAGALWLCGKRVVGPDPDAALARVGADTLVCLNEREELESEFPDYVEWLERNRRRRAIWFPIPDLHAPPLADALELVDELDQRLRTGEGLILHCAGGIGRAPTMAICILIARGWSSADASAHVAEHRPMAGPEAGAQRELVAAVERVFSL